MTGWAASTLAQEHIIRGVGRALEGAGLVARPFELAALRVEPLHRRDCGENAAAAPGSHVEFQPRDIVRPGARGVADGLADHGAAVGMFPGRSGIMTADG